MAKLSAKKIASMKINDRECDSRNLYFAKTRENGGKWSFRYQRGGKNHEMGLGPYPIISISRARYKAQQRLVLLYEGKDPLALKRRALENEKFSKSARFTSVAGDYLDRNRSENGPAENMSKAGSRHCGGMPIPFLIKKPILR